MSFIQSIHNYAKKIAVGVHSSVANEVKKTVDTLLNGGTPTVTISKLASDDYIEVHELTQREGAFPTTYNKQILTIDDSYRDYNRIKNIENELKNVYNFYIDMETYSHQDTCFLDYAEKIKDITPTYDPDYLAKLERILRQNSESINRNINVPRWDIRLPASSRSTDTYKSHFSSKHSVLIQEERLLESGRYESGAVSIPIYEMPQNFAIATDQQFDEIESRGSQTPMRFYNKNQGRRLTFQISMHQQDYPETPILSIAESLQNLARPYKHTDYSLIPKTLRVFIPGRTFRCYLTSVNVTMMGEDYSSWNENEVRASLENTTLGAGNRYAQDRSDLKLQQGQVEDLHYSLARADCSLVFAVIEEIKLVTYTSSLELAQQQTEEENRTLAEALKKAEYFATEHNLDLSQVAVNPDTGHCIEVPNYTGNAAISSQPTYPHGYVLATSLKESPVPDVTNKHTDILTNNNDIQAEIISVSAAALLDEPDIKQKATLITKEIQRREATGAPPLTTSTGTVLTEYELTRLQTADPTEVDKIYLTMLTDGSNNAAIQATALNNIVVHGGKEKERWLEMYTLQIKDMLSGTVDLGTKILAQIFLILGKKPSTYYIFSAVFPDYTKKLSSRYNEEYDSIVSYAHPVYGITGKTIFYVIRYMDISGDSKPYRIKLSYALIDELFHADIDTLVDNMSGIGGIPPGELTTIKIAIHNELKNRPPADICTIARVASMDYTSGVRQPYITYTKNREVSVVHNGATFSISIDSIVTQQLKILYRAATENLTRFFSSTLLPTTYKVHGYVSADSIPTKSTAKVETLYLTSQYNIGSSKFDGLSGGDTLSLLRGEK